MAVCVASVSRETAAGGGHPGRAGAGRGEGSRGGRAARLAALFSPARPQLQPTFVPVPRENTKKRKRVGEEESTSQLRRPRVQAGPAEEAQVKKRRLSGADRNLANRESALASADLEEVHQKHGQKEQTSQAAVKGVRKDHCDVDHRVVSQRKKIQVNPEEERLKNERTVFVGNLPVTCNKKTLKSFFKEYGQVESVRFRSVGDGRTGRALRVSKFKCAKWRVALSICCGLLGFV
ncbi:RNA-binding protein 34 [Tupaia chinensis]|uniref:RNA-binding protein 34 n=1 Tax=Tupaia chinensis TaxID=246437 RepID=L9L062_TUPCH|nr:RNA-binding protein 34 [Tupaia chinensis]